MTTFNEEFRYGSARWATEQDMHRARLFDDAGLFVGFHRNRLLRLAGDAPLITFGGAGTGKLRDLNAFNACGFRNSQGIWQASGSMVVNDPRGEITSISIGNKIRFDQRVYCINPFGLHGLPQHRVNPWNIIRKDSPTFHADVKLQIEDLIPLPHGNDAFFYRRGRELAEALAKTYVWHKPISATRDAISMPEFYDLLNATEDSSGWDAIADQMLNMPDGDIRRLAAEMDNKRQNAPKEYSGIVGSIYENTTFLSLPNVREAFSGSDFSLEVVCKEKCTVSIIIPTEYFSLLAPVQRQIFGTTINYKNRHPAAPTVLLMIDEAAQLGNFEALLRAYNYGRGMGIRAWSFWQDPGQITRNFGPAALSSFIGSSQCRQFIGTRDLETGRMASAMAGQQTLEYDSVLEQDEARRNQARVIAELMNGGDPFAAGLSYAQFGRAAKHRTKQARALITDAEVMNMQEHEQLLFISGLNCPPIRAQKYPYYTRPEMAGAYLPNPYHPPYDRVPIAGHWRGWARVITERVPAHLADWPQHQSGEWSYVEGYRPV